MPSYFMVLEADRFHREICPALATSWLRRSFSPCRSLCGRLAAEARSFTQRYHTATEDPLLCRVTGDWPFDRHVWRHLAAEFLLYSAVALPEIETSPDILCCLLAPDRYAEGVVPRERFALIQQAHFGARDLSFGSSFYRPDHAGYNDHGDVVHLARYLASIRPDRWTVADLQGLGEAFSEEERAEELDFAREWFPALQDLYRQAADPDQIIVCEIL